MLLQVSCSAKITKKTEASTRAFAKGLPGNTFSKLSCAKLDAHVPSKRKVTPISDRPTCNSLKSPEFEHKQNEDALAVQSTEGNNNFLKITDHAQSPGIFLLKGFNCDFYSASYLFKCIS